MSKRLILINAIILLVVFILLEISAGYFLNSRRFKKSALLYAAVKISNIINQPESDKLKRVLFLRQNKSVDSFPSYLYDSQLHESGSLYWFGHPPSSLIVYCDEGSGLTEFTTNKFGFRSIANQKLDKPLDLILIGDSYTEGACVNSPHDIASVLGKDSNLFNLGRGGSGPLFQLGLIKEFMALADSGEILLTDEFNVVWIIFTGNDLKNLAEERQTILSSYLNDGDYSQNYFYNLIHKNGLTTSMRSFHDSVLAMPSANNIHHDYGETVIAGSVSEQTALRDFGKIAYRFNHLVKSKGGRLNIVVLENHPSYDRLIMKDTQEMLVKECSRLSVNCLRFDLSDNTNRDGSRGHLSESEYYNLSSKISALIASPKRSR